MYLSILADLPLRNPCSSALLLKTIHDLCWHLCGTLIVKRPGYFRRFHQGAPGTNPSRWFAWNGNTENFILNIKLNYLHSCKKHELTSEKLLAELVWWQNHARNASKGGLCESFGNAARNSAQVGIESAGVAKSLANRLEQCGTTSALVEQNI